MYSGVATTLRQERRSHASPVLTSVAASDCVGHECMSWQRFGVTKVNFAERFGVGPRGTSRCAQSERFV